MIICLEEYVRRRMLKQLRVCDFAAQNEIPAKKQKLKARLQPIQNNTLRPNKETKKI